MPRTTSGKMQRASRACGFCHARGLKCRWKNDRSDSPWEQLAGCLTCKDYEAQCTMARPIRKRGRKPARPTTTTAAESAPPVEYSHTVDTPHEQDNPSFSEPDYDFLSTIHIQRLVRIYRDTMYQCYFPFLPEDDLLVRWEMVFPIRIARRICS